MTQNEVITETIVGAGSMALGSMKMVRVGSRLVALVRTSTGFHALDNACPHEGYGLVQGALDGELLTCEWHNWKFAVADGSCVLGEEGVASHAVCVVGDDVEISVVTPTSVQLRAQALESLKRGIDTAYNGQMARDSLQMLHAGAEPVEIIWEAIARPAPSNDVQDLEGLLRINRTVTKGQVMVTHGPDHPPRGFRTREPCQQRSRQQRIGVGTTFGFDQAPIL